MTDETMICGITKQDLLDYRRLSKRVEMLKKGIKKALADNEGREINFGTIKAREIKRVSRRPSWKDEVVKLVGQEGVDKIIANTPEKVSTSFRVDKI